MNPESEIVKRIYCGVEVDVLVDMNHSSLVRHREREIVVEIADLILERSLAKTA